MKQQKIIIILLLLILSIIIYLIIIDRVDRSDIKTIHIPKIVIPKKPIEFSIIKNRDDKMSFTGVFQDPKVPKSIAKLLSGETLKHKIIIDNNRESSSNTILAIKEILSNFSNSYIEWSIVYRDRKISIAGETTDIKDRNRVDRVLNSYDLNASVNIEIIEAIDTIESLKLLIAEESRDINETPTEEDIKTILSTLRSLTIEERPITKTHKRAKRRAIIRRVIKKRLKNQKRVKRERDKHIDKKGAIVKKHNDIDIKSLPFAKPVVKEENLKTKKPLVVKETIYLKSDQKRIDKNIPWAKLHDIDEEVDGIFIPEVINR